jgi:hypothetical protein
MTSDTGDEGLYVGASGDPERPVAVRLVDGGSVEKLARSDAWRLWSLLQAELVRTMPSPPARPQAAAS